MNSSKNLTRALSLMLAVSLVGPIYYNKLVCNMIENQEYVQDYSREDNMLKKKRK